MPVARTLVVSLFAIGLGGCDSSSTALPAPGPTCSYDDPAATLDVSGVYRYWSPLFSLRGTITFAQSGSEASVLETTYASGDDRSLMGSDTLAGNRLDMRLVPVNGDTDYSANVTFSFSASGNDFCLLAFDDTNGDRGGVGSYYGERL